MGAGAIVLAGGRSSRMGRSKALLPFDGKPLIVHIVSALQRLFTEIVVVAAPEQELPDLSVTLVRDEVAHQGPVGGIYYGLAAARSDCSFVTSCDSAFLRTPLITYLVSLIAEYDVVVPHWEGRMQPLHAVYRREVVPLLEGQLARGELRPVQLFEKVRTRTVGEEEIRRFDPEGTSFFNMNTPEDYAEALVRWYELSETSRAARPAASISCTVELFGVARLISKASQVTLDLPAGAALSHVLTALAAAQPALVGRVINPGRDGLVDGYACNVNGLGFVRSWTTPVTPGDSILILAADAGG